MLCWAVGAWGARRSLRACMHITCRRPCMHARGNPAAIISCGICDGGTTPQAAATTGWSTLRTCWGGGLGSLRPNPLAMQAWVRLCSTQHALVWEPCGDQHASQPYAQALTAVGQQRGWEGLLGHQLSWGTCCALHCKAALCGAPAAGHLFGEQRWNKCGTVINQLKDCCA